MKIGIDCRLWDETGVGRYIRNLVLNLLKIDKKNEYVLFVLEKDKNEILKQVQNDKIRMVNTNIHWHTLEEQLRFPQIINRENLDLMHFPYISVPFFYNKPFVVTIHDLIPHHFPTGEASTLSLPLFKLKFLGYKFVVSSATKRAKKIITVSNATKKEIVDHLKVPDEKVMVTYEGVFSSSKLKTQNSKLQFKIQKYFLYVGNAFPHKNLDRLLEAFSLICHPERSEGSQLNRDSDIRQNDTRLVFVGKEDYFYKRLKEKVRNMNLDKSVIFAGEVSDEELSSLYQNAKALVMPSLMEGFGLPALEAMANKCLVLASNIPTLQEICGEAAIYFDPYNIKDIVVKMNEVYSNDTYHYSDKKEKGLERSRIFSWKKMANETRKIYESCVSV